MTVPLLDPLTDALGRLNLEPSRSNSAAAQVPIADQLVPASPSDNNGSEDGKKDIAKDANDEEVGDAEDNIRYQKYRPSKLTYGRDHPDPVVENT